MLQKCYEENATNSQARVYKKFPCFKNSEFSFECQPRSENRPSANQTDENVEKILNIINAKRRRIFVDLVADS